MANIRQDIYAQFFEQYLSVYDREIAVMPNHLHIARALFLFAYTDYFGKIMFVANTGDISKLESVRNNFTYVIENYFPPEFIGQGKKLYLIYRCGCMHAVFPKYSGLSFLANNNDLFVLDEVGIPAQRYQIEVLNLWKYQRGLEHAMLSLKEGILNGNVDATMNIHKLLTNDIFGDKKAAMKFQLPGLE